MRYPSEQQGGSCEDILDGFSLRGGAGLWQLRLVEVGVRRLIHRRRETGSLEPRPRGKPNHHKLDASDEEQLRRLIAQTHDMILGELAAATCRKTML
jgi:hypothetical protein